MDRVTRRRRTLVTSAAALGLLAASCGGEAARKLTATDVTGIPPGSGTGTSFSGQYVITGGTVEHCDCSRPSDYCSTVRINVGHTFVVTQNGGSMTAVFAMVPDLVYTGAVNADGTYRLGVAIDQPGTVEYAAMYGRIRVGTGGTPTGADTTQEFFSDTTDFACDSVKGSFASDYQAARQ